MKKLSIILFFATLCIAACKKDSKVSQVVTASYPTVMVSGPQYYSINTGGTLPTITGTAYDSFYKESDPVTIDNSTLDNSTPGLYIVQAKAKNKYGYIGTANIYVAVTNVPTTQDISGTYKRDVNGFVVNVTKVANGLYYTDNVGGTGALVVPAYFAVLNDTTIDFGTQPTSGGTLTVSNPKLSLVPGDTTYQYKLNLSGFSPDAVRNFIKQ